MSYHLKDEIDCCCKTGTLQIIHFSTAELEQAKAYDFLKGAYGNLNT